MMGVSLDDVLSELPVDSQAHVEAEAERMYEDYMTLQQLRKAHEMTQVALSEKLGKQRATIAQMEKRSDLMISTLRDHVEALGENLSLQVEFPGHRPAHLQALGDLDEPPTRAARSGATDRSWQLPTRGKYPIS